MSEYAKRDLIKGVVWIAAIAIVMLGFYMTASVVQNGKTAGTQITAPKQITDDKQTPTLRPSIPFQ